MANSRPPLIPAAVHCTGHSSNEQQHVCLAARHCYNNSCSAYAESALREPAVVPAWEVMLCVCGWQTSKGPHGWNVVLLTRSTPQKLEELQQAGRQAELQHVHSAAGGAPPYACNLLPR